MITNDLEKKSYIIKRINGIVNREILVSDQDEDFPVELETVKKSILMVNYAMEDYVHSLSNDNNETNIFKW